MLLEGNKVLAKRSSLSMPSFSICRSMSKSSSEIDEEGACADGESSRSDLTSLGALEETPLHLAARHSRTDVANRLLDSGADANSRDRLNRTPLHLAIGADAQGVFQVDNSGIVLLLEDSK